MSTSYRDPSSAPPPPNVAYELIVLRGPDPPEDGQVRGGVVGELVAAHRSVKKLIYALLLGLVTGMGGTLAWVYAAGQEKGKERAEMRQLRLDVDECRRFLRRQNWLRHATGDTPDP